MSGLKEETKQIWHYNIKAKSKWRKTTREWKHKKMIMEQWKTPLIRGHKGQPFPTDKCWCCYLITQDKAKAEHSSFEDKLIKIVVETI